MKELHGDALSAQVWLGLRLLMANCPKQLLQMRVILQGVRQAEGNVNCTDGCHVAVHGCITSLEMLIQVGCKDHQHVLKGQEHCQVELGTETLECLLLTLVDPPGVVL